MTLGYGWAARVGHLYPSGGLCDYEVQLMAPEGVQFVTTRLPLKQTGIEHDLSLVDDVEWHCQLLLDAEVELIALNCTVATMLVGSDLLKQRIRASTGLPSVTTIEAVINALRAAKIERPALMTPYPPDVVEAEVCFLRSQGLRVAACIGEPCLTPVQQGMLPAETWLGFARSIRDCDADGLLISCAGVQLAPVLDEIEREFGRPVVASNQALLWQVLRTIGIASRPHGYGSILAGAFDQ